MKVLALAIASTFNGQRKYFQWASQVSSFFWALFIQLTAIFKVSV